MSYNMDTSNLIYSLNNKCIAESLSDFSEYQNLKIPSLSLLNIVNSDISAELSVLAEQVNFLLSSGHAGMEYYGDLEMSPDHSHAVSSLFLPIGVPRFLKTGFMFRIAENIEPLSDMNHNVVTLNYNDYIIFNKDVDNRTLTATERILATDFNIIRDYESEISAAIGTLNVPSTVKASHIITDLHETSGLIGYETRQLMSSDVSGLTEYVEHQIYLSVDELSTTVRDEGKILTAITETRGKVSGEFSRVTNDFIDDETISVKKITNLSTILSSGLDDLYELSDQFVKELGNQADSVHFRGDIEPNTATTNLQMLLHYQLKIDDDYHFRKGFLYRITGKQTIKDSSEIVELQKNDFILINKQVILSDILLSDVYFIKDYDNEISDIWEKINGLDYEASLTKENKSLSVITNITQTDGLIGISAKRLVSSDVLDLDTFVRNEINLSIDAIDVENKIPEKAQVITSITQTNAKIDYATRRLVSSDVDELDNYVKHQIDLSVDDLSTTVRDGSKVLTAITETRGKVSGEFSKVTNDFIDDETISITKIKNLSSTLSTGFDDIYELSDQFVKELDNNADSMHLRGSLSSDPTTTDLEKYLHDQLGKRDDYHLMKGFTYRIDGFQKIVEGSTELSLGTNDFVIIKNRVILSDITLSDIYIIKDYDDEISAIKQHISQFDYVVDLQNGSDISIITHFDQKDGQVSLSAKRLVSSDVLDLDTFVRNEINISVDGLSADVKDTGKVLTSITETRGKVSGEFSKVTNDFIDDESISINKITNLSSTLSTLSGGFDDLYVLSSQFIKELDNNADSMHLRAEINADPGTRHLSVLIHDSSSVKLDDGYLLRKGFVYRIDGKQFVEDDTGSRTFNANDFIIIAHDVILSNIVLSDINVIRDYDQVETDTFRNFVRLSGNNSISNYNEFTDIVRMNILSVNFKSVYDLATYRLSDLIDLDPCFQSLYNAIVQIINRAKLPINFYLSDTLNRAYEVIVEIADQLGVSITEYLVYGKIISIQSGFDALNKIINTSDVVINDSLRDELTKIDNRFDISEKSIANLNLSLSSLSAVVDDDRENVEKTIRSLSVDDTIAGQSVILSKLEQKNGKISYTTRDIQIDDVQNLTDYVENQIKLSIQDLDAHTEYDGVLTSITEVDGKVTAGYNKIQNSYIQDNGIAQVKIINLTSDLANISSELTGVKGDYVRMEGFRTRLLSNDNNDFWRDEWLSFKYNSDTKPYIVLGNDLTKQYLSVNCTDFIKDGMLLTAYVDNVGDPSKGRTNPPYIVLEFNTESGSDPVYIEAKSLIQYYDGKTGITITYNDTTHHYEVAADSHVVAFLSDIEDEMTYVNKLMGTEAGQKGIIADLSDQIAEVEKTQYKTTKYTGHIRDAHVGQTLSDLIVASGIDVPRDIPNNSIFDVQFTKSQELSALSASFTTADDFGLTIGNGDIIIIHDCDDSAKTVSLYNLTYGNIDPAKNNVILIKAGVQRFEFEREKVVTDVKLSSVCNWLDWNFRYWETVDPSISVTYLVKNVQVSGNMDILSGSYLSADTVYTGNINVLSGKYLSVDTIYSESGLELSVVNNIVFKGKAGNFWKMEIDDTQGVPTPVFTKVI